MKNEVYYTNVDAEGNQECKIHVWTHNSPYYDKHKDYAVTLKKHKRKEVYTSNEGWISYLTNSKNLIYLERVK